MKIIALTLLGLACALTGNYIACRLNTRVILLEKLEIMINAIVCEVNYLSTPSENVVQFLSERKDLSKLHFLKKCNDYISVGADFRTAWQRAVTDKSDMKYLNKSDRSLLEAFGNQFGTTDSEGLLSICSMYLELFKENLNEAKECRDRYASLSSGLGLLAGVGTIIVFF